MPNQARARSVLNVCPLVQLCKQGARQAQWNRRARRDRRPTLRRQTLLRHTQIYTLIVYVMSSVVLWVVLWVWVGSSGQGRAVGTQGEPGFKSQAFTWMDRKKCLSFSVNWSDVRSRFGAVSSDGGRLGQHACRSRSPTHRRPQCGQRQDRSGGGAPSRRLGKLTIGRGMRLSERIQEFDGVIIQSMDRALNA